MGDTIDLSGNSALEKIKSLANKKTIMFCSFDGQQMTTRPMAIQSIDDDGAFWFLSAKDSDKNQHILIQPHVHLIYADNSSYEYLSIEGTASVEHDQKKTDELWSEWAKTWFPGGKTDPNLTLLKVIPEHGHYWDTKNNKMISLIKIGMGALTGNRTDNGLEGNLNL